MPSLQENFHCVRDVKRWTVRRRRSAINNNLGCWASGDQVLQQADFPNTERFEVIEVFPTTLRIDEDRIQNSVSIHRATLEPLAKYPERQLLHTPYEPGDEWYENFYKGEAQTTTEEIASPLREYASYPLGRYLGQGYSARYVLRYYS